MKYNRYYHSVKYTPTDPENGEYDLCTTDPLRENAYEFELISTGLNASISTEDAAPSPFISSETFEKYGSLFVIGLGVALADVFIVSLFLTMKLMILGTMLMVE